jgi:hypothetical protein
MIKDKVSRETALESFEQEMSAQQHTVFDLLQKASNHYRFLLVIICSTSFKTYFEMIMVGSMGYLLPVREQRNTYGAFKRGFQPSIATDSDVKQPDELEDVAVEADEWEDAEVEADELNDGGSSKRVS